MKLEMELYVLIWLLLKIVTEMTTYHWSGIFENNDDKWHVRNIQIKFTIIIIVQYTISENVPIIVELNKNYNRINIKSLTLSILTLE